MLFGLITAAALITGCSAGMTREERLEAFKADVLAVRNPRIHFEGHPDSSTVDYNMVASIGLDNRIPGNPLAFLNQTITDVDFSLTFTVGSGPSETVTGTWYDAGTGGALGEDWYIRTMTDDTGKTIP
jgi:hypothetical protein